ncbi:MAG: hypothetical protein FJ242_04665 [Nitrospira sp.]|nr:hypothetical protein [Nitrospira sp.]
MDEDAVIRDILSIPHRCYTCERLDGIEFDYMCKIQHQIIRNDNLKANFIEKGLCNYHFWNIASLTTPETIALMCEMLIENNEYPSHSCSICDYLKMKEGEFLNDFVKDIVSAFGNLSEPLEKRFCQLHFTLIMKELSGEIAEYFSSIQKFHNEQLLKELKSFVEKKNSSHERNKNERTSWWRAVEKLVGRKGMWGK